MIDILDRDHLLALGADLDYPHLTLGSRTVGGEDEWRGWLTVALRAERAALLRQLAPALLVATPGGRGRLDAWTATHDSAAWPLSPEALRERIRDQAQYFGDGALLPVVTEAFARLPDPVRDTLLTEALIFGVGADMRGWQGPARVMARPGAEPATSIIVFCDAAADTLLIVLHEMAHGWLANPHTEYTKLPRVIEEERVLAMAREERWPALPAHERRRERDERLAQALAVIWSGTCSAAS